jgi:hypothetical protein
MVEVMQSRFRGMMDGIGAAGWVRNNVLTNPLNMLCIRNDDGFLIATLYAWPWYPRQFCNVIVVCTVEDKGWSALSLLRASIDWARYRRAMNWRYESDTPYDIAPLMKRLGVPEDSPRYKLNLEVTNG